MASTVIYDACVLYSAKVRDELLELATTDIVRARWTHDILDEMTQAIVEVAKSLGIAVHDHIIVGKEGHASFKGLKLI